MRVDGGESVCEGPGNGRRVEILLKTKVVFGKDVVGSSKIKSGGGGGGGTGKERNKKSQAALASGRFGGSSDRLVTIPKYSITLCVLGAGRFGHGSPSVQHVM